MRPPLAMAPTRWFGHVMELMNRPAYRQARKGLNLPADGALLEIGFGTGAFAAQLLDDMPTILVAGVDPSAPMVAMAQGKRAIRKAGTRADLRLGSVDDLDWPAHTFDAVVAIHTFQFWAKPELALKGILRVLKPGGVLRLLLRAHPGGGPSWLPNPVSRSKDEVAGTLRLLGAAGFEQVVQIEKSPAIIDAIAP
ncbi:MAG TPA: class I SAM-dependent methyltransferase [Micropepsaceae bacterium]|nr:class I SAM-dependent methyltransferase [Micropepsaceae bacterium]